MTLILASRPNVYSSSPLDRIGARREDAAWIEEKLRDPDTLFVPVWRNRNLVRGMDAGAPEAVFIAGEMGRKLHMQGGPWAFLGLHDERAVFALDISTAEDPVPLLPEDMGTFVDLRSVGWGVPRPEASVLAHARGLMHWRARHRFCGVCGGVCDARSAGHVMFCTACETQHFPRTDPAVIMLVTRGDRRCLATRSAFRAPICIPRWPASWSPAKRWKKQCGARCSRRPAFSVGDVHYHSSQPWPFPGNIMLGFYGEGLSEDITIDPEEMLDVRWFSREQIANPEAHNFLLPRADSIARRLIEDWMAAG